MVTTLVMGILCCKHNFAESRKRKSRDWEANDYYDSDEDTFLDRTGTIEKKRESRMKAKNPQQIETYQTLVIQTITTLQTDDLMPSFLVRQRNKTAKFHSKHRKTATRSEKSAIHICLSRRRFVGFIHEQSQRAAT